MNTDACGLLVAERGVFVLFGTAAVKTLVVDGAVFMVEEEELVGFGVCGGLRHGNIDLLVVIL
jgi:hypothetical protein